MSEESQAARLYQIRNRKKRPEEAFAYNALSQSWERVMDLSRNEEPDTLFKAGSL